MHINKGTETSGLNLRFLHS